MVKPESHVKAVRVRGAHGWEHGVDLGVGGQRHAKPLGNGRHHGIARRRRQQFATVQARMVQAIALAPGAVNELL